jgi:hypothetical protein
MTDTKGGEEGVGGKSGRGRRVTGGLERAAAGKRSWAPRMRILSSAESSRNLARTWASSFDLAKRSLNIVRCKFGHFNRRMKMR